MWPPEDEFYSARDAARGVRPNRPLFQGDVFVDVPFTVANPARPDGTCFQERRANVLLIGHPCVMRAGARVLPVQSAVEVRDKSEAVNAAHPFERPYESHYHYFPLPSLLGNEDHVADFRRIGTTLTAELDGQRVACLSRASWVALQHRYVYHSTRHELDFEMMLAQADVWWNDVMLWEEWTDRGLPPDDFEAWMKELLTQDRAYSGTTRRDAAAFAPDDVRDDFPEP